VKSEGHQDNYAIHVAYLANLLQFS